jgi:hypothetical protein
MKEKFLPWFLLFCALGLSGTAAYYSVVGLSIVFVGVALPVIIMGSFLEISKIAIATYLHDKWKETYGILKIYMSIALVTLSLITSLGIYGLLSTGFQGNIAKLEINEKRIKNVEVKRNRFNEIKIELTSEKTILDGDITKLRDGVSNNTTTQSVDKRTGQVITRANNGNRKLFESQLLQAQVRRDTIAKRIDNMNDSITQLDIDILNMESKEMSGSELGALKYVSELLDWDIKRTANLFILILIFVFDPLAITLVIATNQAFKKHRKEYTVHDTAHDTVHDTAHDTAHDEIEIPESYLTHHTIHDNIQVEPIIIEKIVEVPVEVIVEVEKIVEVPVEVIVDVERIVEVPVEVIREVPVDRIIEIIREIPVETTIEVPFKYYINDLGQVFDEEGIEIENSLFNKKIEEIERKILKYKK